MSDAHGRREPNSSTVQGGPPANSNDAHRKRPRAESDEWSHSSSASSPSSLSRVYSPSSEDAGSPSPSTPRSPPSPEADGTDEEPTGSTSATTPWRLEWSLPESANTATTDAINKNALRRSTTGGRRSKPSTSRATFTEGARLTLAPRGLVCLVGRGQLRCRSGRAALHGWDLAPPRSVKQSSAYSPFVDFDSPAWNSLVTVEAGDTGAELELRPPSVVAAPEDRVTRTVNSKKPPASFVRLLDARGPDVRPTVVPHSWKRAADAILQDYRTKWRTSGSDPPPPDRPQFRVAIAGAKSTGKSTCLRYLVNRLLSGCGAPNVAVLDVDCGQPELGPPGLLTLTVVVEPLLRPPHGHPVRSFVRALFFGSATPQDDPTRYLDCLRDLVEAARTQLDPDMPLCLNLHGWVKGLGGLVLQSILDVAEPTHFLQLVGKTKSQHFTVTVDPDRTVRHDVLSFNHHRRDPRRPAHSPEATGFDDAAQDNVKAIASPETAEEHGRPLVVPPPISVRSSLLRTLRLASYFLQDASVWDRVGFGQTGIADPDCEIARTLAARRPYKVPFEAVEWGFASPDAARNLHSEGSVLDVLNASIVGLCHRGSEGPAEVVPCHMLPCFGLGIIRSIDRAERVFHVLTPVPEAQLARVNCLVHGSIPLPLECCFRGPWSEAFPYMSVDVGTVATADVLGADPMRSRNNIGRRGLVAAAASQDPVEG